MERATEDGSGTDGQLAERLHAHRLTLLSVSSGMVGVCLTAVGLIGVLKSIRKTETVLDELLTVDALVFVYTTGVYFMLLRPRHHGRRRLLDYIADASFFLGLVLLLVACVVFSIGFREA